MDELYGVAYQLVDGSVAVEERKVDPTQLADDLARIREAFERVLDGRSESAFPLKTVEVGLSVTAEGKIIFVGVEVTASLTLTFEREP